MFERATVLIVDDNRNMRTILRTILRGLTFERVVEAGDGVEAFEVMRSCPVDVISVDLAMKPLDGLEFAHMVRTAKDSPNPFVPIVMVTGYTSRQNIMAARDAGIDEILAKPVTSAMIADRLQRVITGRRQFVKASNYFGPDRRRFRGLDAAPPGKRRRQSDQAAHDR